MPYSKERAGGPAQSTEAPATLRQSSTVQAHEAIRRELETVLDSPEFRGSHRGQVLLRYLVENALQSRVERLKERTIGVELFHRDVSYDTGQDAIVRVAANDIRKRLAAHYRHSDTAQAGSTVRISLLPGSYAPDFEIAKKVLRDPAEEALPSAPVPVRGSERGYRDWTQWIIIAVLTVICGLLAIRNVNLRPAAARRTPLAVLPWSLVAAPGTAVTLVAADVNFAFYKSLVNADQSLPVYTSQRWLDDIATRLPGIPDLSRIPFTSIADASISARISSVLQAGGCSISVRSGRMMQVADFKSDRPVILLGSAYPNPWVGLLNDHLNFRIEYDPILKKQVCRNMSPRAGESPVYAGTARTPMSGVGYATISLVPNLSHNSFVLIIAGTNMEGTEAAGELVTDLPRLARALRSRGIDPNAKVEQLELLMRLDHINAQSSRSEIIAHRATS